MTAFQSRQPAIDCLRGIAAMWVVLYHLGEGQHIPDLKRFLGPTFSNLAFDAGHLGVAIFFVLSGYVMSLVTGSYSFSAKQASRFLVKRLIRLSPPYYFAIIVALAYGLIKTYLTGAPPIAFSIASLAAHLLYLQGALSIPHFNLVFWTLCVEVQFYIAFSFTLFSVHFICQRFDPERTIKWVFRVLWIGCIASLIWPLNLVQSSLWPGGFMPFWYAFAAGVLSQYAIARRDPEALRLFTTLLVGLIATYLINQNGFTLTVLLTSLVIYVSNSHRITHSWGAIFQPLQPLQFIGLISYSLYLLHNQITGAVTRLLRRFIVPSALGDLIVLSTVLAVCTLISYVAFLAIERPSIRWSNKFSYGMNKPN